MAHVLVVEDEPQLAESVREILGRSGYSVSVAATGEDALRLLEAQPADVIILDLMLPGIDGFEVCRRIRDRSLTPVLMLTALDAELDTVLGFEVGADDYVTKPFRSRELVSRVRALQRRGAGPVRREGDELAPGHIIRTADLSIYNMSMVIFAQRPEKVKVPSRSRSYLFILEILGATSRRGCRVTAC